PKKVTRRHSPILLHFTLLLSPICEMQPCATLKVNPLNPHPPDDRLLAQVCCWTMAFEGRALATSGNMLQWMVTSTRRVCEAPKLPSSRRTSSMFLAGTDDDWTRVTLALHQAAAAVRQSAAGSRRTAFLERQPLPSGRRDSDRG